MATYVRTDDDADESDDDVVDATDQGGDVDGDGDGDDDDDDDTDPLNPPSQTPITQRVALWLFSQICCSRCAQCAW